MRTRPRSISRNRSQESRQLLAGVLPLMIAAARNVRRSSGSPAASGYSARDMAQVLGKETALNIGKYWRAAKAGRRGPIDVIDIFSGCGGMSAGFQAVNGIIPVFNLVMAADVDAVANATYCNNLGIHPLKEDVSRLGQDKEELLRIVEASGRRKGNPLVLIGCAPCQGFSSHRNQSGSGDQRNSLFVTFSRIAAVLKPDAIVIENVPELLTTKYWSYIEESRSILAAAGYSIYVGVHNMAEFGVPQERFRAVILAFPKSFVPPRGFLPRARFRTVRQSIGGLPKIKAGQRHPKDPMHYSAGHQPSTIETIRAVPKDGGNRPPDVGPECLRRGKERQGKAMYEDVYGRLFWDRPAITITAYARNPASGRFVHPEQDRGLSVREAALLQGFPSDYWFSGSLDERFRQIGNAVPPAFASYLACYLLGELLTAEPAQRAAMQGILEPVGASFSRMIPALKAGYRDSLALMS
jgi:DNA (cytosine-5)-methyltransferase 1